MKSFTSALAIFLLSNCGRAYASMHKPRNAAIQPQPTSSFRYTDTTNPFVHSKKHRDWQNIDIRGGQSGGTATMSNEIFNLVKSIVGAGVLSLPAGIAAFGDAPSAVIPAVILITVIGAMSGYGFSLIGRVCAVTNASTYREAWDRTVGTSTSWITAFSSTFSCLFANLAYSMILADTFQNLLMSIGVSLTRTQTLFGVTALILTPLCLLKDLSSLAPFSLLGILGMAYTAIAMAVRYFGGAYAATGAVAVAEGVAEGVAVAVAGAGGQFAKDVAPAVFGSKGAMSVLSPNSFILISMLSTAYMVSNWISIVRQCAIHLSCFNGELCTLDVKSIFIFGPYLIIQSAHKCTKYKTTTHPAFRVKSQKL